MRPVLLARRSTAEIAVLAALLAGFAVLLVRTAWMGDDAFITLRTVDNLVNGHGPRWNVGERVQAYTHPLWMVLLSAVYWFTREAYFTTLAVSGVCALLGFGICIAASRGGMGLPVAAILISSRAFVDYSTSGLENPLTAVLVAALWVADRNSHPRARPVLVVLCGALVLLNRLDLVWLIGPILVVSALSPEARTAWWKVLLAALPLVAWEVFSVLYYGFPVPNTAYAKLATGIGSDELIPQGLRYLSDSLRRDPVTLPAIAAGLVLGLFTGTRGRLASLGLLLHLCFVVRVGGDFMTGRFLSAPLVLAVMVIGDAGMRSLAANGMIAAAAIALGLTAPVSNLLTGRSLQKDVIGRHGITDERAYYYQFSGLMREGAAFTPPVSDEPARVQRWIAAGRFVVPRDAVGVTGYVAGPRFHLVDVMGLADPLMARLPAERPWRIGHFVRLLPDGYVETLATGRFVITDSSLNAYYHRLSIVIKDPIFSRRRLETVFEMNAGRYDHWLEDYVERRKPRTAGPTFKSGGVTIVLRPATPRGRPWRDTR